MSIFVVDARVIRISHVDDFKSPPNTVSFRTTATPSLRDEAASEQGIDARSIRIRADPARSIVEKMLGKICRCNVCKHTESDNSKNLTMHHFLKTIRIHVSSMGMSQNPKFRLVYEHEHRSRFLS